MRHVKTGVAFCAMMVLAGAGFGQVATNKDGPGTTDAAGVELKETEAVKVTGMEFQLVAPTVWVAAKNNKEPATIPLTLKMANKTGKDVKLVMNDAVTIQIKDAMGKEVKMLRGQGPASPEATVKNGEVYQIDRTGKLENRGAFRLAGTESEHKTWSIDGLKAGKYTLSMAYANFEPGVRVRVTGIDAKGYWRGVGVTNELPVVITDKDTNEVILDAIKNNPPDAGGHGGKLLDQPKVTRLASTNVHLGGATAIANPFMKTEIRCVLMGQGVAAPWRFYAIVGQDQKAIYPFDADKDFLKVLIPEGGPLKLSDEKFLDGAKLTAHLKSPAMEDGWVLVSKPEDFMAITFNMPKDGTPEDAKRKEDAKKITAPTVTRGGVVVVKFFAWKNIGGNLQEWTVEFGREFKGTVKDVALGRRRIRLNHKR